MVSPQKRFRVAIPYNRAYSPYQRTQFLIRELDEQYFLTIFLKIQQYIRTHVRPPFSTDNCYILS